MGILDWMKRMAGVENAPALPVDEADFCVAVENWDGERRVVVYTPHLGTGNRTTEADMALEGSRTWTLEGYTKNPTSGQELAIWSCGEFGEPEIAAALIAVNHHMRVNYDRLFVRGQWREEDLKLQAFFDETIYRLDWR